MSDGLSKYIFSFLRDSLCVLQTALFVRRSRYVHTFTLRNSKYPTSVVSDQTASNIESLIHGVTGHTVSICRFNHLQASS